MWDSTELARAVQLYLLKQEPKTEESFSDLGPRVRPCQSGPCLSNALGVVGDNKNNLSYDNKENIIPITVSITDQGPGISIENQNKLFKNFIQINPNQMQQGQGSGLYIYIYYYFLP